MACLGVNIQPYKVRERRLLCACMRRECIYRGYLQLFPWEGHNLPQAADARVTAHSAPALKEAVRAPLSPIDGWDLTPIPLNTGGGARCCRCVVPRCVLILAVGGGARSEK